MSRRLAIPFSRRQPTRRPRSVALTARATLFIASACALSACPHENRDSPTPPAWSDAHATRGSRATANAPPHAFPDVAMLGQSAPARRAGFSADDGRPVAGTPRRGPAGQRQWRVSGRRTTPRCFAVCATRTSNASNGTAGGAPSRFACGSKAAGARCSSRSSVPRSRTSAPSWRPIASRGCSGCIACRPRAGGSMERARLQSVADASGDAAFSERVTARAARARRHRARRDAVLGARGRSRTCRRAERWSELLDHAQPLAPGDAELAADLSRLVLFDFVTDNVDRWSGGNILRQHLGGQERGARCCSWTMALRSCRRGEPGRTSA